MAKNLVIVESPAKAKTINKILGADFLVKASMGHVRDLPEKDLGVDVENNFKPKYVAIKTREKVLKELRAEAEHAEKIYLAPDPDREGEAIAWHLMAALTGKNDAPGKFCRVTYNEITAPAIREAFAHPREINQHKVDSQQARRILDRIVGYQVSPLLWRRIRGASSAGRVQSVALRLVCERERLILNFKPEEYWLLGARVRKFENPRDPFEIRLARINGEKADVKSGEQAHGIKRDLEGRELKVSAILRREIQKRPRPSLITSSLQQAASSLYGFAPKRTMQVAQKLYEGMDMGEGTVGLITYMRTDSFAISPVAAQAAREFINKQYGVEFLPDRAPVYKSKGNAQEAHEAIRPTDVFRTPDSLAGLLSEEEMKLYRLIWQRFVASQMVPAKIAQRTAEFEAVAKAGQQNAYLFRASTSEVIFPGYMKVTGIEEEKKDESPKQDVEGEEPEELVKLPELREGEPVEPMEWLEARKETQPPPRFSEASLIRALEEDGVGRPSTYASIMSTIVDRHYVEREKRQLRPTQMGFQVNDFLVSHLSSLFDIGFTASMEKQLDEVEEGKVQWHKMLGEFYGPFTDWVSKAKGPPADVGKVKELLSLLSGVAQWAPPPETKGRGGRKPVGDEKFAASIREQLEAGEKAVSDRQLEALVKLSLRYKDQLPRFDEVLEATGLRDAAMVHARSAEPPDAATLRKLELLNAPGIVFGEPRKFGKRVFDDAKFAASLRDQARSGKGFSENQYAALDKLFLKYVDQMPDGDKLQAELMPNYQPPPGDPHAGEILALMGAIAEWRPATEAKGRTWDDRAFYQSLATQFARKKTLSPKQVGALKKMLRKYAAQVPNYDAKVETLGLLPQRQKKD